MFKDDIEEKDKMLKPEQAVIIERPADSKSSTTSPGIQSQDDQVYQKLVKEIIFDMPEKVFSLTLDPSMILKVDLALFRLLSEKKMKGILLGVGRPAEFYIELLRSNGFNQDFLFYLDTLTFSSPRKQEEPHSANISYKHVFYYQEKQNMKLIPHPSDFTAIDVAFTSTVEEFARNKSGEPLFLLIDGIASHQLYLKPSSLGAFIHTIVSKARNWNIRTFLLLTDGIDPILSSTIKTFSDKIIVL